MEYYFRYEKYKSDLQHELTCLIFARDTRGNYRYDDPNTVRQLLDSGADIHAAAPSVANINLLINKELSGSHYHTIFLDSKLDFSSCPLYFIAAIWGSDHVLNLFLNKPGLVNKTFFPSGPVDALNVGGLLHYVILFHIDNKIARLKELIARGADINLKGGNGFTPLRFACEYACFNTSIGKCYDLEIISLLIEKGASIDADTQIALQRVASEHANIFKRLNFIRFLISKQILDEEFLKQQRETYRTASGGNLIHKCLEAADVNQPNLESDVEELLKVPVFLNQKDSNGDTPLSIAVSKGWGKIVNQLIDFGAEVNLIKADGSTLLHLALRNTRVKDTCILKRLLELPALKGLVNAVTQIGETPLHVAVAEGNTAAVAVLLQNGADPTLTTANGKGLLEIAEKLPADTFIKVQGLLAMHATLTGGRRNSAGMISIQSGTFSVNTADPFGNGFRMNQDLSLPPTVNPPRPYVVM
jgi:ankyrin repeat protein